MSDNYEPVPTERTIVIVDGPNGLVGDRAIKVHVDSENPLYAIDLRNQVGVGQKITDVDTPTIAAGTSGGLSFVVSQRGTQARLRISATAADTYTVVVRVKFGGGWRSPTITVKAT